MKKVLSLLLLMITISSCVGCESKNSEVTLNTPIHNTRINGKRTTDKIVYKAKGNKQYHRNSCRHKGYITAIKTSDAIKAGLTPCTVCKP